jgi:hypothetical protein
MSTEVVMARIYISATYSDLQAHREQVYRALRELGHDVIAMEDYVADDQRPLARCLADVAACQLYVVIFAHRYGYIPQEEGNPEGRSITELEYRHAEVQGIPRLIFLLDQAAPWQLAWVDAVTGDGDQGARIRALREELGRERLASFFASESKIPEDRRHLALGGQAASMGSRVTLWPSRSSWRTSCRWWRSTEWRCWK